MPSLEMRHISCLLRLSLLPEMGQRARIFISEKQWLPLLKCLATGWFASLLVTATCSRCGMLYIGETGRCLRTRFGEHRRAVTSSNANKPVARHFNSHCVSDIKIRALCPISGSNYSRKRHEMRLISKLGTVHPLGIYERFSYI